MKFTFSRTGQAVIDSVFSGLFSGLQRLTFRDNFRSYLWSGTLAAGAEAKIPHPLGVKPAGYVMLRKAGGEVEDGAEPWTEQFVTIRNQSSIATTVTLLFLAEL